MRWSWSGTASWAVPKAQTQGGRGGHPIVKRPAVGCFRRWRRCGRRKQRPQRRALRGNGGGLAILWGIVGWRCRSDQRERTPRQQHQWSVARSGRRRRWRRRHAGPLSLCWKARSNCKRRADSVATRGPSGNGCGGSGGGGGGGVLVLPGTLPVTVTARSTAGAAAGTTLAAAVSEFPVNGANPRQRGKRSCLFRAARFRLHANRPFDCGDEHAKSAVPGLSYTISVTVQNLGSETVIAAPLSSLLSPLGIPSVNWSCWRFLRRWVMSQAAIPIAAFRI